MTSISDPRTPRYPVRLVAERTGLTPHVLRAWERRHAVVAPSRSDGGQRLYSLEDIERLSRLRLLTERGHAIGRIAALPLDELDALAAESEAAVAPAAAPEGRWPSAPIREFAEAALAATRRLDAADLQATLERAAVTLGVGDFLDGVVAVTLSDIGRGWTERSVSVAQEHLATGVFRRVLGWLLGVYEVSGPAPRIVVATPPGQAHELGALMVAVSAAAEGWEVTYLGPDLPVADLLSAATQREARAVALSVVCLPDGRDLTGVLREARTGLPERVALLVGGAGASRLRLPAEAGRIEVVDSLPALRVLLQRLAAADSGERPQAYDRQ